MNRLLYALKYQKGGVLVAGEVGCGKTTLISAAEKRVSAAHYRFCRISNPAMIPMDLIRAVSGALGGEINSLSKAVLLAGIEAILKDRAKKGVDTVLCIDEAHVIDRNQTLDELRMLLNYQTGDRFLITLVLIGQPPLLSRIERLHPLKERIGMRIKIVPLDFVHTGKYILFRMNAAGRKNPVFSKEAIWTVYKASGGIPLRINTICDRSLLIGAMEKSKMITEKIVSDAIDDLEVA